MKRFFAIILLAATLISAFSLAACQKEKTTYETVSEAIRNTLGLASVDIDIKETGKTNTSVSGTSVSVSVDSDTNIRIEGLNTQNSKYISTAYITASGATVRSDDYYDGEYFYTSTAGTKVKISKDDERADFLNSVNNIKSLVVDIPEDLLTDIVLNENEENKTKSLEIEIEDEKFKEIFSDYIDLQKRAAEQQFKKNYGVLSVKNVTNGSVGVVINEDGYIESYTVSCKLIFIFEYYSDDYDDMRMAIDTTTVLKFNNPGESVTITAPDDLDDYELEEVG